MSQTTYAGRALPVQTRRQTLSVSLKRILGRDWAAAYLFVLPTLLLLGGLIAYPFVNAVYLSFTNTVTLQTGPFVGLQNYQTLWNDPAFRQLGTQHDRLHCLLGLLQVLARALGSHPHSPHQAFSQCAGRLDPAALDHPVGGDRDDLAQPARPGLRRRQPVPAADEHRGQGFPLARCLQHGHALGHHGQHLAGHPLLHHHDAGRSQLNRRGALRSGPHRRRQRLASLPARDLARSALCHHRGRACSRPSGPSTASPRSSC